MALPPSFSSDAVENTQSPSTDPSYETELASIHRTSFPDGFVFGTATASYQVEGAVHEGGRKPSIWDTFTHTPGKISDGSTGDVACDQYHKYQEDIDLMEKLHLDAYRFSIAWPRIFPEGLGPEVNKEGVAYYNNVIDGVLEKGIRPFITLYHWDLPQALQDSFGGWTNRKIVEAFADYADTCFSAFGDRVKDWITFNEPQQFAYQGYGNGIHAPGRCSWRELSSEGDSSTETYLAGHHILLAHAAAVEIYRKKYKDKQAGVVGITLDCQWGEPMTSSSEDQAAAQRHVESQLGWYLDPIYFGDYPAVMRKNAGTRLPQFSKDEVAKLHGSLDFIGLNHYTTRYIKDGPKPLSEQESDYIQDQQIFATEIRDSKGIGERAASEWLYIVPWGLQKVLTWTTVRYNHPMIFITENGMDDESGEKPLQEMLHDTKRIQFYQEYLTAVLGAIREGADVRGYFAWSLLDNFEWAVGYTKRFGLIYVDYEDGQKRYIKDSASAQSRSDVLDLAFAATVLLQGLVWKSIQTRRMISVEVEGVECFSMAPTVQGTVAQELQWVWEAVKNSIQSHALVVVYGAECVLQVGLAAESGDGDAVPVNATEFQSGTLCKGV